MQSHPAAAQQGAAATQAESVELDPITLTATRQPERVLDVPATVDVITREDIERRGTRDVQDLVRYQPGVDIGRVTSGTDPFHNLGSFTIRGVSANRVQLQVDGARVIERITDGTRDFVDLPFISRVEILRGPGSVLWGADALGGIVSFRTLDPDELLAGKKKNWAVRSEMNFDSFDRSFSKTVIGVVAVDQWQVLAGFNHRTAHEPTLRRARADGGIYGCPATRFIPCNMLDPVYSEGTNALGKLVFRPSGDHEFKLTGEAFDRTSTVNQLFDFNAVSLGIRNGDYTRIQDLSRYRLALSHEWKVGAPWLDNVRWNVSYSPQERALTNRRMQTLANGQPRATYATQDFKEEFLQADVQFTSSFALWATNHRLTYGFQGDTTDTDYNRQDIVTNLATRATTITRAGGFNFANATTTRADGYIQDEIGLLDGRLTVTPGVRLATYSIDPRFDGDYKLVPGKEPRKLDSTRVIPQVGAIYRLDETYSVYGRYAEGFKMPTAQQLYTSLPFGTQNVVPNPDLKPEEVKSYEAGIRGKFDRGWFSLGVFHADYTNFIQELYEVPGSTDITSRNLAKVKLTGIEASAEYAFNDEISANASFSYQVGDQRTVPGARMTAFDAVVPMKTVLGLKWTKREYGLETELVATFAAPIERASTPSIFRPGGYALLDAYLNWRPIENLRFRAGIQNIFDERYFPSVRGRELADVTVAMQQQNPLELQTGPGRSFKLGATLEW